MRISGSGLKSIGASLKRYQQIRAHTTEIQLTQTSIKGHAIKVRKLYRKEIHHEFTIHNLVGRPHVLNPNMNRFLKFENLSHQLMQRMRKQWKCLDADSDDAFKMFVIRQYKDHCRRQDVFPTAELYFNGGLNLQELYPMQEIMQRTVAAANVIGERIVKDMHWSQVQADDFKMELANNVGTKICLTGTFEDKSWYLHEVYTCLGRDLKPLKCSDSIILGEQPTIINI